MTARQKSYVAPKPSVTTRQTVVSEPLASPREAQISFISFLNQPVSPIASFAVPAVLSIFFILIIIYVANEPIPLTTAAVPRTAAQTRLYVSEAYGYKFRYPSNWTYEVKPLGEFEEVVLSGNGETIIVRTTNEVSTSTLIPAAPETVTLNGISALRYHDYDSSTGEPQDRIVISRPDGLYHEVSGYGPRFERLAKSFTLSAP